MNMQLVVISGPDQGRTFPLADGQTLIIGRGQTNDTHLGDPHVSRVHCQVEVDGGAVVLIDRGGAGGTLVKGREIEKHQLQPGDVVQIGQTELRFLLDGAGSDTTVVGPGISKPKPRPAVTPLRNLAGESIGVYQIEQVIAKGASGMVCRAHDTEHDRTVALKVLDPDFSGDEENMRRFVRAMKTMLPIRHENIVSIYAAGKNGPYCWVAMEYVEGENLAEVIDRIGAVGQLDWKDAFRVAVHIARALQEAYEHKIIHRNITPTNIVQRTSDKVTKLCDLMLAKALEGTQAKQVTQPGELVGDVAYMAPERTRGQSKVDGRSDIYGLGATVYALLTARPPFEGHSLPELISKIRQTEAVKPKQYQLGIPDLFEDLVLRMLAKRPEDRYQTAEELLADLLRVGRYQSVEA